MALKGSRVDLVDDRFFPPLGCCIRVLDHHLGVCVCMGVYVSVYVRGCVSVGYDVAYIESKTGAGIVSARVQKLRL